jgi:MurNAc alpha-1-phosphate uridylyltransferase
MVCVKWGDCEGAIMIAANRSSIDHAMVLAAGLGTRMRPITNTIPKPLVEIKGRTILDRNIDLLHTHGVKDIVVNGHHLMPVMEAHLAKLEDSRLILSSEPELLDQGGGIKQALPHLGSSDFFVLNGDAFWVDEAEASNLERLEQNWDAVQMDFLLLIAPVESTTGYDGVGDFFRAPDGRLTFRDDADSAPYVFTGAGIYSRTPFEAAPDTVFPLVPMYRKALAAGRLFGVELTGHWFHIGTPQGIVGAEKAMATLRLLPDVRED